MQLIQDKFRQKKTRLTAIATVVLLCAAVLLIWFGQSHNMQAINAFVAQVYFEGEYRIEDGAWQEVVAGVHIPATKGDVTLRGKFHMRAPDGEYIGVYADSTPLAFCCDHLNLTFLEDGTEPITSDHENPIFGTSGCGVDWVAHTFSAENTEPVEILIHNPHHFGNENAIDDMLSKLAIWESIDFEKNTLASGKVQRSTGFVFMIASFVLLGIALFSFILFLAA